MVGLKNDEKPKKPVVEEDKDIKAELPLQSKDSIISRNLHDQFDSMSSLNRLSNDLNFDKYELSKDKGLKNNKIIDYIVQSNNDESRRDSFLTNVIQKYNEESSTKHQQTNAQLHK
jgi:hypothetical protein